MTTAPLPLITADTAPRDAVRLALEWLGDVVPDVQVVRSQGVLRRTRGSLSAHLRFQSSTWSRRGTGTWVGLYLSVHDKTFDRWRRAHPEMTWRTGEIVHATGHLRTDLQLFGNEPGYRTLDSLPPVVDDWLGVLDLFHDPHRLAEEYDVGRTFAFTCMEWLVFRGDVASARRLLERYLDAHPALRVTIDAGRAAGLPPPGTPIRNEVQERWAPTLERLGIVAPGEPLPGVAPDVPPEPVDGLTELRSILGGLGRVEEV